MGQTSTARTLPPGAALGLLIPLIFPIVAWLTPVIGQSIATILVLDCLVLIAGFRMIFSRSGDLLEPVKVISFYFLAAFAIAPLGALEVKWHFSRPFHDVAPIAAAIATAAYVFFLLGYSVPGFFLSAPATPALLTQPRVNRGNRMIVIWGAILFGIGMLAYLVMFFRAGGFATILFSGVSRTEFFLDFGYLFWFASFLFPGALLIFAGWRATKGPVGWVRYLPAILAFGLFLILQGRSRSIIVLIVVTFASHYLIAPLKLNQLARYGAALVGLSIFVGVARAGSIRSEAISDPIAIISSILENITETLSHFLVNDISRLRQVAVIYDKVPSIAPYESGESFFVFMNPWLRLAGQHDRLFDPIGPKVFHLARPDLPHMNTGMLPSMLGEFIFNFHWAFAMVGFLFFGIFLRIVYYRLIQKNPSLSSVCAYVVLLTWSAQFILSSIGQSIFEMAIWLVPILATFVLSTRLESEAPESGGLPAAEPFGATARI